MMDRPVYFEFKRVGGSVKVCAVDSQTATEVVVVCPATATEAQMKQVALQKLRYVLERRS